MATVRPTAQLLNETIGSRFLGSVFELVLQGFVAAQAWTYFTTHGGSHGDVKTLQLTVGFVVICTLIQSILLFHSVYQVHVLNFMNPQFIRVPPAMFPYAALFAAWITAAVQGYFVSRCYKLLGRPKWLIALIALPLAYGPIGGIAVAVITERSTSDAVSHAAAFRGLFSARIITSVFVDVVVTAIILWRFRDYQTETSFGTTRNVISRLLLSSMTTCFLTTMVLIISAVLFYAYPHNSLYFITFLPLTSIYACSMFVQLNSRNRHAPSSTAYHSSAFTSSKGRTSGTFAISMADVKIEQPDNVKKAAPQYDSYMN